MPNLFGLNIAKLVSDSIAQAGGVRPGVLSHMAPGARTAGDLASGVNPTTTMHSFKGFVERRVVRRRGFIEPMDTPVVTLLGASVSPSVVPAINDVVTVDGAEYTLLELLSADPAAAVYEFAAEG